MFSAMAAPINDAGYYEGIRLSGKVRIVSSFGDVKVKVVNSFPDLRVKVVQSFPDDVGEWQFVEYGEDFTVQFNTSIFSQAYRNKKAVFLPFSWRGEK